MGLYIEARIRADLDDLWARTQEPSQHQRWDLRFTLIAYLPRAEGEPQRFRYATRVLPGLTVAGTGVCAGERERPDGTRTSALRFSSPHPLSLLAEGSGYWRYVPEGDGVLFLTGYDYRPRWGRVGAVADRLLFRPLIGWATAWSFDRLRLWLERGSPRARPVELAGGAPGPRPRRARRRDRTRPGALPAPLRPAGRVDGLRLATSPRRRHLAGPVHLPLPGTPAARRCSRRPATRVRAPRVLRTLETPR